MNGEKYTNRRRIPLDVKTRLRQIMREQGISNYQLAKMSNMPPTTIRNILNGTSPSVSTLAQLCGALGISLAQFFTDAEHESFYPLTQEQAALVEKWGKLKAEQKKAILTIMDGLM